MNSNFKTNVLAELARITAKGPASVELPRPSRNPLFAKACVRANFQVSELANDASGADEIEELLAVSRRIHTKQSSVPRWELDDGVRRQWLRTLENKALLRHEVTQVSIESGNPLQRMLTAYINGSAPPLEKQHLEELAATSRVE